MGLEDSLKEVCPGLDATKSPNDPNAYRLSEEAQLRQRYLALGGHPRRHGCTQREKLVRVDPGRGPGTDFEPFLNFLVSQPGLLRASCGCRMG